MGGRLGFGGTLKPGMGAPFFLVRMGEDGLLRGYVACMYVEMWVWGYRREVCYYDYISDFIHNQPAVRVPAERDTLREVSYNQQTTMLLLQESFNILFSFHMNISRAPGGINSSLSGP